jgi:hypothetical protein
VLEQFSNTHVIDRLATEAITAGLAFASVLWWASTCLVGSFRPQGMADPYWPSMPDLRTDTAGFIAFIISVICLTTSEYLRLHRRHSAQLSGRKVASARKTAEIANASIRSITQAVCETIAILATGLVSYLSVNAVTHPATLLMRATHLLPWPAEGTLRVIALILCVCSVSVLRFLQAESGSTRIILMVEPSTSRGSCGKDGRRRRAG